MLLAGDIGGTKTVLAVFKEDSSSEFDHQPVAEAIFPSSQFDSLEAIVAEFLRDANYPITGASFGVAGPVVGNRAQITNLPWVIDGSAFGEVLGIETRILNDLEAIANAVPTLQGDDLFTLNAGHPEPTGAIGVIAPGTGLGEAFLVWTNGRYESYPSEGGHAAFAPTSKLQMDLLAYWQARLDHVSYERLCSGIGIPNLYQFLRDSGMYEEPASLRERLDTAVDPTPVIVTAAINEQTPICVETLNLFMEILGGESANLALKVLATGGIFIGGGIAPRILPQLQASRFMELFCRKGRFSEMMGRIPVHVIRNPKVALYGAAYEALRAAQHA